MQCIKMSGLELESNTNSESSVTPTSISITTPEHHIKHLVISGGSYGGLIYYGLVKELMKQGAIDLSNIETLYGTSVGTYLIVFLLLDYDWETIDDYLIKRPWNTIFTLNAEHIVKSLQTGGILDKKPIYSVFEPLFKGKDIPLNITLQEFYEKTQKEVHFFTTDLQELETVDLSHKTHPDWKLIDAVYASGSLPIIFEPHYVEETEKIYLDGAVLLNYPINRCLADTKEYDHILGIYHSDSHMSFAQKNPLKGNSFYKLIEYVLMIIIKLWVRIKYKRTEYENNVPHQIPIDFPMGLQEIIKSWNSAEERERLIRLGETYAQNYIEHWGLNHSHSYTHISESDSQS